MSIDELYRELIMDHYRAPRGRAPLARIDREGAGSNPICGDEVTLGLMLEGDTISGVEVQARGCALSVASGSLLAEAIEGKTLSEARGLAAALKAALAGFEAGSQGLGDLEALTGVKRFPMRMKCVLLPWVVLLEDLIGPEREAS